jgi:hypothetical protein
MLAKLISLPKPQEPDRLFKTKACAICGKPFTVEWNHGKTVCCSEECKRANWIKNHPSKNSNCLNCGKPLSLLQLRHGKRRGDFCSQKCNFQYYLKLNPNHQSMAGKHGGLSTAKKHPENMRNAYSVLTPELRRENKRKHDQTVVEKAEELKKNGFLIIFQDSWSKPRPDIIAYKNGELFLLDVKTGRGSIKVLEERKFKLVS